MHKVNNDNPFSAFYFNFFDEKNRDAFFELDGVQYKFSNNIDEKNFEKNEYSSIRNKEKYIGSTLIATQRIIGDSQISGLGLNNNQPSNISKKGSVH